MQPEITGASYVPNTTSQQGHLVSWKQPWRYCRLPRGIPEGTGRKLTSRVRKFLTTQREKSGLHSLQYGTKTETHAPPPPIGARRQPLQVPVCSHQIALSRLIQNCTRGHLHNIRVQSKYRKVQHSLRHVAGTGGVGGAKGAVDRCVN